MRGSRWPGLLAALLLMASACADEVDEQAAREQAVHSALGSIREETVTAMFYAAQDEWDRPSVFRTATAIQAMKAAGETAQRIMDPLRRRRRSGASRSPCGKV